MNLFWLPAVILGAASSTCHAAAAGANDDHGDISIYTEPQRLVEVEPGRKLDIVCLGVGSPTVVFDIGI